MGSTMAGYIAQGDDITYRKNFRVTKKTFDVLLTQLQSNGYLRDGRSTNPHLRVPGRFKLGVCLVGDLVGDFVVRHRSVGVSR